MCELCISYEYSHLTGLVDHMVSDASMETATLVATMEVVAATEGALVSYAVLPGIKPISALRQVEALFPLPKEVFF